MKMPISVLNSMVPNVKGKKVSLYYLNSRYYNPIWGRFLNVDSVIGANRDILGNNLYAYCSNNPASKIDFNGFSAINLSILGAGGMTLADSLQLTYQF